MSWVSPKAAIKQITCGARVAIFSFLKMLFGAGRIGARNSVEFLSMIPPDMHRHLFVNGAIVTILKEWRQFNSGCRWALV
ncbi:MAG: hypothetical protein DWQ04_32685 [Chloroflexi bacterium]|nr:MAG: hypothetical protein DWQ04_32685 [Chloroflexota bacterium]